VKPCIAWWLVCACAEPGAVGAGVLGFAGVAVPGAGFGLAGGTAGLVGVIGAGVFGTGAVGVVGVVMPGLVGVTGVGALVASTLVDTLRSSAPATVVETMSLICFFMFVLLIN